LIEPPPVYSSPRQLPAKERSFSLALRSLLGSLAACAGATAGSLGFHHFAWRLRLRHAFFAARLRARLVNFLAMLLPPQSVCVVSLLSFWFNFPRLYILVFFPIDDSKIVVVLPKAIFQITDSILGTLVSWMECQLFPLSTRIPGKYYPSN